jgi:hypothetical protein
LDVGRQETGGEDRRTHQLLLLVIEVVPFAYDRGPRHRSKSGRQNTLSLIVGYRLKPI